ncbi:MAG: LamG domain-containing protein [Pirellulaceae bacterium]|nr:LamG domain-containing protein [Pirellulaceae bacterium]
MLASHCLLLVPRRHPYGIGCALIWIMAMLILTSGPSEAAETGRDGLVLEYQFEADAKDSSGNARHGTTIGKPHFVAGKSGQCIELDGQQDYVDCGTTLADLGQTFTVECWVNPAARQNLHADVLGNHNHGGYGFVVEQDADNTNRFAAAYGAGAEQWVGTRPVAIAAGKWQHLRPSRTTRRCSLRR